MESQAPYTPRGPRDLSTALAAWLRKLGFTATEQVLPDFVTVAAHWLTPRLDRFELDYTWLLYPDGHAEATCRLRVLYAGEWLYTTLFTGQRVWRLRDVRVLLTGNVRYANARLLAQPAGL